MPLCIRKDGEGEIVGKDRIVDGAKAAYVTIEHACPALVLPERVVNGEERLGLRELGRLGQTLSPIWPACEMPYAKPFPSGRTPCAYYQLPLHTL